MSDLFEAAGPASMGPNPLADRLRPSTLAEVIGQDHLLGLQGPIGRMAANGRLASMILWGPPGVGKTTIARLLAKTARYQFQPISAVFSGVADLKAVFEQAKARRHAGQATLLFVDEIHRFNRGQQDALLPYVEDGAVTLVGATTENPALALNGAVLSRAQVYVLRRLGPQAISMLLDRAEDLEGYKLPVTPAARKALAVMADGDGRYALALAETLFALGQQETLLDTQRLAAVVQGGRASCEKGGQGRYDLMSAFRQSIRGSDPDAALYWLARMLVRGDQPLSIARELMRAAAEDIGQADPTALLIARAAKRAYDFMGLPEAELHLAQAVVHLAAAPKSNAVYVAYQAAMAAARERDPLTPSAHPSDAPISNDRG